MMFFLKMKYGRHADTPKYKPTNLEHDEKKIVGGIINSWAVDNDFNLIDENIDHNNAFPSTIIY